MKNLLKKRQVYENNIESTMKIKKVNTIISLSGSNPLHEESMNYLKQDSIVIYLDLDKDEILKRSELMKLDRIVGQKSKSLSEILDFRKEIYNKYYDYRIIIGNQDDSERITDYIVKILNLDEFFISTRSKIQTYDFFEILKKGLADDFGLFVPQYIPFLYESQWRRLVNMPYNER